MRRFLISTGCLCFCLLAGCRTGVSDALGKGTLGAFNSVPPQSEPPLDDDATAESDEDHDRQAAR